jgi:hypothetical protein
MKEARQTSGLHANEQAESERYKVAQLMERNRALSGLIS